MTNGRFQKSGNGKNRREECTRTNMDECMCVCVYLSWGPGRRHARESGLGGGCLRGGEKSEERFKTIAVYRHLVLFQSHIFVSSSSSSSSPSVYKSFIRFSYYELVFLAAVTAKMLRRGILSDWEWDMATFFFFSNP